MAKRYWRPGGNGIWSSNTNWSTTDTGATGQTPPSTSDIAYFTANSGSGTVTIDGDKTFQQLNCTGYTGSWQANGDIIVQVTTHLTLSPTMSFGNQKFTLASGSGSANINFNGAVFPYDYHFTATGTKTLQADIDILGSLFFGASPTINGDFTITCYGLQKSTTTSPVMSANGQEIILKGGKIDRVKKGSGKLVLDGDIEVIANPYEVGTAAWGTNNSEIEYKSGNIDVELLSIFELQGTSKLTNFENVKLGRMSANGTCKIDTDIYVREGIQSAGTTTATFLSDNPQKLYVATEGTGDVIMYNQGTFISDSVTMVYKGTGTLFSYTSFSGADYVPVNSFGMDFVLDTNGTLTLKDYSSGFMFGNNRKFKYVKGTLNGDANIHFDSDFTFDLNGQKIRDIYVDGNTINFISDAQINNLSIYNKGIVQIPNDGTELKILDNIDMDGTYGEEPSLQGIITLKDMQGRDVEMKSARKSLSSFKRITGTPTGDMDDWTVAFDFIHVGESHGAMIAGNFAASTYSYIWAPVNNPNRIYLIYGASVATHYFNLPAQNPNERLRIVITKKMGSKISAYINGNSVNTYSYGTTQNNRSNDFGGVNRQALGDVLFFKEEKSSTWVTEDYNKFLANGKTSNGVYDATEPGLFIGYPVDTYTLDETAAKVTFEGNFEDSKISKGIITHIDASDGQPLISFQGETYGKNIIDINNNVAKPKATSYA